jgi:phosphoribosylformylglycinamidine synthase II
MRAEIFYSPKYSDGRAARLLGSLSTAINLNIRSLRIVDIYILEGLVLKKGEIDEVFADPVAQESRINTFACETDLLSDWDLLVEIAYKPGVTDTVALTAREALKDKLPSETQCVIQTATQYLFGGPSLSDSEKHALAKSLYNPLIQMATVIDREDWRRGLRPPRSYSSVVPAGPTATESFEIAGLSDDQLLRLSKERLLALTLDEMKAIQRVFARPEFIEKRRQRGLNEAITDVELEMIAQTWSEHCKHKIFASRIQYRDGERQETIVSLFETYIKRTTEELAERKGYLKSVFHDNSGVISFDDKSLICFKVETHNTPSALDPYGGAITGIVGVNRDIMGTGKGAKPIFNTNVLCFGPPTTASSEIPAALLHPRRVMEGVHRGIIDGGNQSGIPVVGGAFLFDESFIGKPLVFCGTGGILPFTINGEEAWRKHVDPGDLAVMVGGRIGKDGIHGATFSSLALDEESPTSAVQIGDPITQKKMLDLLLEARDRGLYKGITDNGAGGLSSSLGEMAILSGGVRIELERCPLKYSGLAPWEILVSESQERMSLAVSPDKLEELLELACARNVEATVVGCFTDSGYVEITYQAAPVGLLQCSFLHEGLPTMNLTARWEPPDRREKIHGTTPGEKTNLKEDILALLSEPNIASKEELVRQYDHEVQARGAMGPFVGAREEGPSDGAVLRLRTDSYQGITVTHGICPRYGDYDTYHMAMCAVDEAFRAHIACGGNSQRVSALDNFCWPDPIAAEGNPDGPFKLAQLVRACRGLRDACLVYELPLISGKDSMKNDAVVDGRKVSVRPTLLISLMGIIDDVRKAVTTDLKRPGDGLFILGETRGELGCTSYERLRGGELGRCPEVKTASALPCYRTLAKAMDKGLVSSCHDLSDGGLAVALCESAFGGRWGAEICLDDLPGPGTEEMESLRLLFCETPSRFLISASAEKADLLRSLFGHLPLACIGKVVREQRVRITRRGQEVVNLHLDEIARAWKHPI